MKKRICSIRAVAGVAAALGVGSAATAQVTDGCELDAIAFMLSNPDGGSGSIATTGGACSMLINGPDSSFAGTTSFTGVACVDLTISATVDYSSIDTGDFDQAIYIVDGDEVVITDNDNEGTFDVSFDVEAGQTFGFGVESVDGIFGPGIATITDFKARSQVALRAFPSDDFDSAEGSGLLTGGCLDIVGGDAGVAGSTGFEFAGSLTGDVMANAEYESIDTADFDQAEYLVNGVPTVFADNGSQGAVEVSFAVESGDVFGFGVTTTDGIFGPGILLVDNPSLSAAPQRLADFPFEFEDSGANGSGSLDLDDIVMEVTGGDSGFAGTSQYVAENPDVELCVRAIADYSSDDTGNFDLGYYIVDGEQTVIADNESQGTFEIEFTVPAGSSFGFGVETVDGAYGSGFLTVEKFRAFAVPVEGCVADINNDGALNIFDFTSFQSAFSDGRKCADINGDGSFNIFDFTSYQSEFSDGCDF